MAITPAKTEALLQKIAKLRILVIGDVMLDDYIWGDATRISPEAPVPVVHINNHTYTAGGAANVALNVASLGAKVELCGAIGTDKSGDQLCKALTKAHVIFDAELRSEAIRTIVKTRVIVRNQQLCRLDSEDSRKSYSSVSISHRAKVLKKIPQADAVIFSDYAKGYLFSSMVCKIRDEAHKKGKFVSWDPKPSGRIEVKDLDLITPNRVEAVELSRLDIGEDDRDVAMNVCSEIWSRYQPRNLVITQGRHGMLLSRNGKVEREIPTAAREVYDVSGAGDTVIATLTLALVAGADLETAAHFANAAAGVVVGKIGTATVTPDELTAYVDHR